MTGGTRKNAADTQSVPVEQGRTASTVAEIQALAEQAEAEAAEAEALAAAARARARAIQLRRQAELIEAEKEETAEEDDAADSIRTGVQDTREIGSQEAESAIESESAETEEGPDKDVAEADDDAASGNSESADTEKPARRWPHLLSRRRRPKRSTIAGSLAIIVIVAALSGSGYMVREHRDAVRQRQQAAEFAAAARQGVVTLTSLDFKDAKKGVQRILENSTGTFKEDFLKTIDDFTKIVEQSKVVTQGAVQATAVELGTMTNDSAVVLVAATSEVTNAAGAKQDPRSDRLIVTVVRDGGQLKISKVEFVP